MKSMPVVGIPARRDVFGPIGVPIQLVPQPCVDAVVAAGGAPLIIPVHTGLATMEAAYRLMDGLLLAGGPHRVRDEFEMELVGRALRDGKPILGVCRGLQLLNVSAGGTHERTEVLIPGGLSHNSMGTLELRKTLTHEVILEPGSRLAQIIGRTVIGVNSGHGWACGQVAPGFRVVARATDGLIEAIEAESGFAIGVQWHPEELLRQEEWALPIFEAFIGAARG